MTGARAFVCVSHSPFMSMPGAEAHGHRYRAAIDAARAFIDDFDPGLVVLFGPDHMNLLNLVRPSFTAVLSGRTLAEFSIPEITLNVPLPAAAKLCEGLLEVGVDMAVAEDVAVDHGVGLTLMQLFDRPADLPLLAVVVNAIGYPLVPLARAWALGAGTGQVLADRSERVLFVGTGGLSHNPPFPNPAPGSRRLDADGRRAALDTALRWIDPAWDREVLDRLAAGDQEWLVGLTQADLDRRGGGANELRTWMAAWAACGHPPATFTAYEAVEAWITGMGVAFGGG